MSSEIRGHEKKKQPPSLMISLPDDVLVDILARVRRCHYPKLSLVSKHFHSLVTSSYMYERRTLLGCTEAFIYVGLYNWDPNDQGLYILNNNNRLILIPSLPVFPLDASFVSVGSKIYVFGNHNTTSVVLSIDCRYHKAQALPSMPMPLANIVAEIIDRRIYVIGYSNDKRKNFMVVFNTETQMWESEMTKLDMGYICSGGSVVMADKMYGRDFHNSFVYMPKQNKWETYEMLNSNEWEKACVLDDILYYYDSSKSKVRAYDPKHMCWQVVKGMELFPRSLWSCTVNYGGKLIVFLNMYHSQNARRNTLRAEIALERRQGGDIWGKVEWFDVLIDGQRFIKNSLVVMV